MLLNASTALLSSKVLLVPYEPHHVVTYNGWMQDEKIREATASESLTLDDEYKMQRSWREGADKLTSIVCLPPAAALASDHIVARKDDCPENMLGDINLFIYEDDNDRGDGDHDDDGDGDGNSDHAHLRGHPGKKNLVGELELMIARKEYQGQGIGRAAVLLFLWYIVICKEDIVAAHCNEKNQEGVLHHLRVKIHQTNVRSIKLFESLLFKKKSDTPNYFGEFELVLQDLDVVRMFGLMKTYGVEECKRLLYSYDE